jgi:hypothetical protein
MEIFVAVVLLCIFAFLFIINLPLKSLYSRGIEAFRSKPQMIFDSLWSSAVRHLIAYRAASYGK